LAEKATNKPMLRHQNGDLTLIEPEAPTLIVHVCNNMNRFGAGFAKAVAERWPIVKDAYHQWYLSGFWEGVPFELGEVQTVPVEPNLSVVNMVAQNGVNSTLNSTPIKYWALSQCLTSVAERVRTTGELVVLPRIGCGLAGGNWELVEPILLRTVCCTTLVTVYDL